MSSGPSSNLVVLAVRRRTFVQLADVLRDWSSLGLISTVHLVDVDSVRPQDVLVPCTVLAGGTTRGVILQEEVAARDRTEIVRLCGLTEVRDTVSGLSNDEAFALLSTLRTALPGVEVLPLHLIGIALQGADSLGDIGWLGWHNVVLAPENSAAPTQGVSPIVYNPDDPVRLTHLAAAVCSLTGLWAAEPSAPFDTRAVAPARSLVAARTYTRHLSAAAVESELLARLASVDQGYPVPIFEGASAWVVEDEVGAASDMADALFAKHPYVFPRTREMPRPTAPKKIGPFQALKMLFVFLSQAIRNAPKAFLDRVVHEASARTAALVGGAVFGSGDTAYTVVVNGVRADGMPASWSDIDEALEAASLRAAGRSELTHKSNADLSALWKDFIGAGLTLVDAGARSQELPPRMVGARRGIVTTAARVAPDPSEGFCLPEAVAPYIKNRTVPSYDVVAAHLLNDQLAGIGQRQPHISSQVSAAQAELKEWFGERQRSYTGRVGWTIASGLSKVRTEISTYTEALHAAQAASDVPSRIERQQRGLAQKLKLAFLLAVVAVVVAVVVTVFWEPDWLFLTIATVLILLVWLIASVVMFMSGQRELFALLHRRREMSSQIEILRQHLSDALDDMRRLSRTYRQYLDWAKAFGRFVHAPLGNPSRQADSELLIGSGLPRNHRFGAARPEDLVLDETSAMMKRDMFRVGWTSEAWDAFLADVPREMGQDRFRLREDKELLFADPGVARESLLTAWADAVADRSDWQGATEALRAKVEALLNGPGAEFGPRLLANVETRGVDGKITSVSYESFINRLDSEAALTGPHQTFDRAMFADHAQSSEPWRVADTVSKSSSANLGRTLVVTQLSKGFHTYDLRLSTEAATNAGALANGLPSPVSAPGTYSGRPEM